MKAHPKDKELQRRARAVAEELVIGAQEEDEESGGEWFSVCKAIPIIAKALAEPMVPEQGPRLSFETWWGWFKGVYGETGIREEYIARSAWNQAKVVERALAAAPRAAGGQREPHKITMDELERMYSASKTCFDPGYNLFWQNFTKAINDYFAAAAAPQVEERGGK